MNAGTLHDPRPEDFQPKSQTAVFSSELFTAVELLTEAREACAACFRVIAATSDPTITDRLDTELKMAGVKPGFGLRIQKFIAATVQQRAAEN
jgi:hypothetical protein